MEAFPRLCFLSPGDVACVALRTAAARQITEPFVEAGSKNSGGGPCAVKWVKWVVVGPTFSKRLAFQVGSPQPSLALEFAFRR